MEAQVQQGGGEVRRVHIIYFLSRKGRVEHPHLIRVHHLSRNGVHLRDVKRWLSELRGKDMPESFAWSYKRKYKAGYVWQDLLDEDLITPISDNEYVLKGSEITSTTFNNGKCPYGEKQVFIHKKSTPQETEKEQKSSSNEETGKNPESPHGVSSKTSFEIEQESPSFGSETSSITDDSTKPETDKHCSTTKQEEEQSCQRDKKENNLDDTYENNNKLEGSNVNISSTSIKYSSVPPNSSMGKINNNNARGSSNMFRNWITCGTVETKESAVMVINRRNGASIGVFTNEENSKKNYKGEIFKGEKLGGSERIAAHSWLLEQHREARNDARKSVDERAGAMKKNQDEFSEKKSVSASYKPINRPKCSQCGRQFKPEKLHAHMKSCRGIKSKSMPKSATNTCDKTPLRTQEDDYQTKVEKNSASSYYLT